MTAIRDLPQIPAQSFIIKRNCEFTDGLVFEYEDGTPISLVGISFYCQVRNPADATGIDIILDASTDNGLLVNGGADGTLRFNVSEPLTSVLTDAANAPIDMLAVAEGHVIGLMKDQPSTMTIGAGYTQVTGVASGLSVVDLPT